MGKNLQHDFIRITLDAEKYLSMEQIGEYMEISDPDRILPSSVGGGNVWCNIRFTACSVAFNSTLHSFSNSFRAFPNEAAFRAHPLNSNNTRRHQYVFLQRNTHYTPLKLTNRKVVWISYEILDRPKMSADLRGNYLTLWLLSLHLQSSRILDTLFFQ